MIINLNDGSDSSFVLIQLFLDSMIKIGKKKSIKCLEYTCDKGLLAEDCDGVFWKIDVNPNLFFPKKLIENSHVRDEDANGVFCVECTRGIKKKSKLKGLCKICEYEKKA